MEETESIVVSSHAAKWLNKGKNRKINLIQWKDTQRKMLRQSGNAYTNRKNQNKPAKTEPEPVSGITL